MLVVDGDEFSGKRFGFVVVCSMKKFTKVMDIVTFTFDNNSLRRGALGRIGVFIIDCLDVQLEFGDLIVVVVDCSEEFQELFFDVLTIMKTRMHLKKPANVSSIEC